MRNFHNILFVSHGLGDETEALKQALSLARNNNAQLKALVVCPELPKEMVDYREKYEASLADHLQQAILTVRDSIKVSELELPVLVEVESGSLPAQRIVRHILRNSHDLLIKQAQSPQQIKGFTAVDMELLRDCPCPVWLSRPIGHSRGEIKVAVAIDPESQTPEGRDLALRLLELSRALADTCSGELKIISCWEYEYEDFLRHNAWVRTEESEILQTVIHAEQLHRVSLDAIISTAGLGGKIAIQHPRGQADILIPQCVEEGAVDILVMGTLGRTGIPGLLIGNTAENVVQKLGCSLLALKPGGFTSPIKVY